MLNREEIPYCCLSPLIPLINCHVDHMIKLSHFCCSDLPWYSPHLGYRQTARKKHKFLTLKHHPKYPVYSFFISRLLFYMETIKELESLLVHKEEREQYHTSGRGRRVRRRAKIIID